MSKRDVSKRDVAKERRVKETCRLMCMGTTRGTRWEVRRLGEKRAKCERLANTSGDVYGERMTCECEMGRSKWVGPNG